MFFKVPSWLACIADYFWRLIAVFSICILAALCISESQDDQRGTPCRHNKEPLRQSLPLCN